MEQVLDELCARAEAAVRRRQHHHPVRPRDGGPDRIPIPALLATAAVHHHLIRTGLRTSVGLVVESGEPREVHHFACWPATAPRRSIPISRSRRWSDEGRCRPELDDYEIVKRYIKAIGKGLLKVMSKMGISTYQSYCGAQIFDAVGLKADFVEKYFTGTAPDRRRRPGRDRRGNRAPPRDAFGDNPVYKPRSMSAANMPIALRGEDHAWTPESSRCCSTRCAATRWRVQGVRQDPQRAERAAADAARPVPSQDAEDEAKQAVPLDEVEPAKDIVKRFATGAMSLRLDLARGAHHAGDRDEPHRRQVQHRRRRRGSRPLQAAAERRFDALGDQAGRLGPLRRHDANISSIPT
jgi:glutamate synthase (NADPH/NADH) large chain